MYVVGVDPDNSMPASLSFILCIKFEKSSEIPFKWSILCCLNFNLRGWCSNWHDDDTFGELLVKFDNILNRRKFDEDCVGVKGIPASFFPDEASTVGVDLEIKLFVGAIVTPIKGFTYNIG